MKQDISPTPLPVALVKIFTTVVADRQPTVTLSHHQSCDGLIHRTYNVKLCFAITETISRSHMISEIHTLK